MIRALITMLLMFLFYSVSTFAQDAPFPYIWSGFSTSLQGRSPQQRHNAQLAGRYIDGYIIPPGGTFSFNELVGGRSRSKGFEAAPFLNGDGLLEDTPGGGICQLASTIYNVGLLGGLLIAERHPHSRTVLHVPPGRDATIASWRKDLKLKNPFPYPLQLNISSDSGRLTVSLRSAVKRDFDVEIISERLDLEPQAVVSQSSQRQQGLRGFSTVTWRVTKNGGRERKELVSEDTYPPPSLIIPGGSR